MPRTLPLFDPSAQPQSWNERMVPGEYAVLYSADETPGAPVCTVFPSLAEAEAHAAHQVADHPTLRCRIYDHDGLGRDPIRELRGSAHKADSEITPRFRRWVGSGLFFGGAALFALDWTTDFRLSWPGMLGARAMPVGLVLLVMELGILLNARSARRRAAPHA